MSEVTFAKTFLTALDKKPIKLPADHVSDPRKYPNQSPYILPRQSHPFPQKSHTAATTKKISVTIKPMRGGGPVTLTDITLDDSIHDIKTQYASKISLPIDKIKLLFNKKPAADLKTFKDLGIEEDVELTAMLMGGASAEAPVASSGASTPTSRLDTSLDKMEVDSAAPHSGSEKAQVQADAVPIGPGALHTADFWSDLKGFLSQRLQDDAEADRLTTIFKTAWASQ